MTLVRRVQEARARLSDHGRALAQCSLAAALAWLVATRGFGYEDPFFAPVAAVVALSITFGQRGRRAFEIGLGVAVGIAVADIIILALGTGIWQIGLIVGLAMGTAVMLGGSALLANQAAVSAILVATVQAPTITLVPHRFFHALIGTAVALVVGQILLPVRPLLMVHRAVNPVFDGLAAALDRTSRALETGDADEAGAALLDARDMDPMVRELYTALAAATETARLSLTRRSVRERLAGYTEAVTRIDLVVRNTRVLARASLAVLNHGGDTPEHRQEQKVLSGAIADLAAGVRALGRQLMEPAGGGEEARTLAVRAVAQARTLFDDPRELAVARVVGQVRATAVDLMRGSGMALEAAQRALDALGEVGGAGGSGGRGDSGARGEE